MRTNGPSLSRPTEEADKAGSPAGH